MRFFLLLAFLLASPPAVAQPATLLSAPDRTEGEGPFDRLVLRGATVIDGTGAPAYGPADIVIEGNRIAEVRIVGFPEVPIRPERRPAEGDREIDASGMYVLPGFVDLHGHMGGTGQGAFPEYVFKLWMGHGITTIRDPGSPLEWSLQHRERSARNEITAPRIFSLTGFGHGWDRPINNADDAREYVQWLHARGSDGIKFFRGRPPILQAALEEASRLGMITAMHHAQLGVARTDVLSTAAWGLTTAEHWYGIPEALFTDRLVQDYPPDYNYQNEQHRFFEAGRLWQQAAPRGSERWDAVIDSLISLDLTLVPTFNIYEASRDLMRAQRAEWHDEYTLPSLWQFFQPSREAHGSYWFYWGTEEEVAWRRNYQIWMSFVNDYKNRGGRVATGSDSGFIYQTYGFGYIRELEMLREAGFHPLEVIWSGTLKGAEVLGMDDRIGSVEAGKLADLVIVDENPLRNLKVLYGTGAQRLNDETGLVERVGGVRYTIKDGIVFDARQLLSDVREMVSEAKEAAGAPSP